MWMIINENKIYNKIKLKLALDEEYTDTVSDV